MSDILREQLKQSAVNRRAMLDKFGFIPKSILRDISRSTLSNMMHLYQREEPRRREANQRGAKDKELRLRALGLKGSASQKGAGRGTMGASIMPAELVAFFVQYYARPGDVYLDPFMGQGVQMQVAKLLGLHYYGFDVSREFFDYVAAVKQKIDDTLTIIEIYLADSREPTQLADDMGDFCFTSPPYWDIEYYGDEPEQLGYEQTYEQFLEGMHDVAHAWLSKFRKGAYCVVNVNDFRKAGTFYPYHADTISLFSRAGWRLHDIWIIEGLVGGLPKAFAVDFNLKRIAPKIHEYALVFVRP